MPEPMLRLAGVSAFYGPVQALFDVELEVRRGEIVCLLGGNASGKSTTMKTIIGTLPVVRGAIELDGRRVERWSPARRVEAGLAIVPEARRVFPEMSVGENLEMGAFTRRDPAGRDVDLARVFELFPRLAERVRQDAGTLSGGEQQMLAMGRALMARPRVIIMDEPSMGLAPVMVESVFELIVRLNELGITIFMVEQNATLALSVADRGYVIQNGRIVLADTAERLLGNAQMRTAYLGE
jgi:branched-chain amino acid transport system ATP-binding protein